jgi:ribonuclease HI
MAGVGVADIETEYYKKHLSDILVYSRSEDITGQVLRGYCDSLTIKHKLPMNILQCPVPLQRSRISFLPYFVHYLHRNNLCIDTIHRTNSDNFFHRLNPSEYRKYARIIKKYNLHDSNAIKLPSNPRKAMSFADWSLLTLYKKTNNSVIPDSIPAFFQIAIKNHCIIPHDHNYSQDFNSRLDLKITSDTSSTPMQNIIEIPEELYIFTDGSLKEDAMGASAFVLETRSIIKGRPPEGNPSSTKAELWAIYMALSHAMANQRVEILTDSHASIDGIMKYISANSERKKIKSTITISYQQSSIDLTALLAQSNLLKSLPTRA